MVAICKNSNTQWSWRSTACLAIPTFLRNIDMVARKSTEDFVRDARAKHGDKYDYSQTVYTNAKAKLIILCKVHGPFTQEASSHLSGNGCKKCCEEHRTIRQTRPFHEFFDLASARHNGKYRYDESTYLNSQTRMNIWCPVHSWFVQTPNTHLRSAGCRKCAIVKKGLEKRHTKEMFVAAATRIHGDKFDYSKVEYVNAITKVLIVCDKGHECWQTPANHLTGFGCIHCAREVIRQSRIIDFGEFEKRAIARHGAEHYKYDKNSYTEMGQFVSIWCNVHQIWFSQRAEGHVYGKGCSLCGLQSLSDQFSMSTETFIERAEKVHRGWYDYSLAEYSGWEDKLCIVCPMHGNFHQMAGHHLRGVGCPRCKDSRGERDIAVLLDSMNVRYTQEQKFDSCKLKKQLAFDFFIEDRLLVEYDGRQHFQPINFFGGEEALKSNQERDAIKTQWAADNGYPLLRIRYDDEEWADRLRAAIDQHVAATV